MGREGEGEVTKEYAKFQEKVKHSIYLDNLSPSVTDAVIRSAFDQANVKSIRFIPNYTHPDYNPRCALVEFSNEKEVKFVLDLICSCPFMMAGMPRPVRARPAEPEMFSDRPVKPGPRIQLRWLDRSDPDFVVGQKLKRLAKKHIAEQSLLLEKQSEMEEKLSKQQWETLKGHYRKYEMMDSLFLDGTSTRLGKCYGVNVPDEARTFDFR
ncbi:hypothetical protein RND81_02G003200 [Saponaria officinalis]|uniref:RRM domain-containing protein n=1 Tax=Saponaria officinalis TaxID=3572 RepID=A0AAW1MJ77_SAPOF